MNIRDIKRSFLLCLVFFGAMSRAKEKDLLGLKALGKHTPVKQVRLPVVFRPEYDVSFGLLNPLVSKLHSFDGCKYGRVMKLIDPYIAPEAKYEPKEVTQEQLTLVHSPAYLDSLSDCQKVAQILEVPQAVGHLIDLRSRVLQPMRYATGGTILATQLALKHGRAINLSGGYHHAKPSKGEGFCVYADIPVAIHLLWKERPDLKVMVVDLDAHQGNGVAQSLRHEIVEGSRSRVALFDMYNGQRYPGPDDGTRDYITYNNPLPNGTADEAYLAVLKTKLPKALDEFKPDLIIYNAGTDILEGDKLGGLSVSAAGILERDKAVFKEAQARKIPLAMVLSGGYTAQSAQVTAESIINLTQLD